MTIRAVAASSGRQVKRFLGRGRWGWLVFIAGQAYLARGAWGKAADGNPLILSVLSLVILLLCWVVCYRVRSARRSQQAEAACREGEDS